jgi:nitrogenase molybdenum-iron protein beta chain
MQTAEKINPVIRCSATTTTRRTWLKSVSFEEMSAPEKVFETFVWTTTKEYQDLNFKREALTSIRPRPASRWAPSSALRLPQDPALRAWFARLRGLLPHLFQPPQGTVLLRIRLDDGRRSRVRWQKNMIDGLENAKAIYKPDMIAVSTTCMAEVIGDDPNAFINNSKKAGNIPRNTRFPSPIPRPSSVRTRLAGTTWKKASCAPSR